MKIVIACSLFICASIASAQTWTLKDEQRLADIERAQAVMNNLDATLDALVKKRESDCRRAIGYAPFCSCVLTALPVAWSFPDYISITTRSKEENNYAKLDVEMKKAYDMVAPIRDACVAKINGKK